MRFKIGQKVVCIEGGDWETVYKEEGDFKTSDTDGPKFNEILTVAGYDGDDYIYFHEWLDESDCFHEDKFEPLISDEQLEKELSAIPEFQTQ